MKYIILISVILLNIDILSGQEKVYDNILKKVEANIDKNYYSDSIFAARHSEYLMDASTQDIKKISCVDYFQTPVWASDGEFYNQKFGFNNSAFPLRTLGYLISAKLYKKDEENNYGYTLPHRFGSSFSSIDINGQFHTVLSGFVQNKQVERNSKNNLTDAYPLNKMTMPSFGINNSLDNQKPKISIEYGNDHKEKVSKHKVTPENNQPKSMSHALSTLYTLYPTRCN
ncbi:MAG: hypothetical protein LBU57_09675 [Dysgonamonadaceae bacterium]|nr:hypothetical protein [Dysgonamonadaceae bacterium]